MTCLCEADGGPDFQGSHFQRSKDVRVVDDEAGTILNSRHPFRIVVMHFHHEEHPSFWKSVAHVLRIGLALFIVLKAVIKVKASGVTNFSH